MPFDKSRLIDLDECVLNALRLFIAQGVPDLSVPPYRRPLVVGSGNAAVTGRVILGDRDAVFADEGSYARRLAGIPDIDGAVLISASGGKHAPAIARDLKGRGIEVVLLTNNPEAPAAPLCDRVCVFPRNPEPYTYNTSTYLGMILGATKENPQAILDHVNALRPAIPRDLGGYDAFYLIVPERFDAVREMFATKFDELFGPMVSGRVFTPEQTKHAKTVVPSDTELFVSFGYANTLFGTRRLNLPLPAGADRGMMVACGYYLIGHIQKQHVPHFKDHIEAYTRTASRIFGQQITPLVG